MLRSSQGSPEAVSPTVTIRERLTDASARFTPAELKVVRELLANYPAAGLETVASLAERARVSDPTVVRMVSRLGFDGYASFQRALLREVEERMRSPLAMLDSRRPGLREGNLYQRFMRSAAAGVEAAASMVSPAEFERAVDLLMDRRLRVVCLGGRFSRHLAAILRAHLMQLRPDTELVAGTASDMVDRLVDLGGRDVLVVFDYRRYQQDVVAFAEEAARQGARLVLFTDPWKSPIAAAAEVTIVAPVEAISPYDSMVPAMAQIEALTAALVARLDLRLKARVRRLEEIRSRHAVTVDGTAPRLPRARPADRRRGPARRRRVA